MKAARIKLDKSVVKLLESGGKIAFEVAEPVVRIEVVMPKDGKPGMLKLTEERMKAVEKHTEEMFQSSKRYFSEILKSMDRMFSSIFGGKKQY